MVRTHRIKLVRRSGLRNGLSVKVRVPEGGRRARLVELSGLQDLAGLPVLEAAVDGPTRGRSVPEVAETFTGSRAEVVAVTVSVSGAFRSEQKVENVQIGKVILLHLGVTF